MSNYSVAFVKDFLAFKEHLNEQQKEKLDSLLESAGGKFLSKEFAPQAFLLHEKENIQAILVFSTSIPKEPPYIMRLAQTQDFRAQKEFVKEFKSTMAEELFAHFLSRHGFFKAGFLLEGGARFLKRLKRNGIIIKANGPRIKKGKTISFVSTAHSFNPKILKPKIKLSTPARLFRKRTQLKRKTPAPKKPFPGPHRRP